MNDTPAAGRARIVFCGRRNTGKSSLVNAVAGQAVSIVSAHPGATTDPVRKAMEMPPLGPVLLVDTAGLDDDQPPLGAQRRAQALRELRIADLAVLVSDAETGAGAFETALAGDLRRSGVPFIFVLNKCDAHPPAPGRAAEISALLGAPAVEASAHAPGGAEALKDALAAARFGGAGERRLLGGRLSRGDVAVFVTPQDASAPKGRLILPQQMALRDVLDAGAAALVCQPAELPGALASLRAPPRIVVTDSLVFKEVRALVPAEVELTSFSILFAQSKGGYETLLSGAEALGKLRPGGRVLIAEGCTHRRQCEDAGTVKIPRWLREAAGADIKIETASGMDFPEDLRGFALVIHCGACMLPGREMRRRIALACDAGVPITNYGLAIARLRGVGGVSL